MDVEVFQGVPGVSNQNSNWDYEEVFLLSDYVAAGGIGGRGL